MLSTNSLLFPIATVVDEPSILIILSNSFPPTRLLMMPRLCVKSNKNNHVVAGRFREDAPNDADTEIRPACKNILKLVLSCESDWLRG